MLPTSKLIVVNQALIEFGRPAVIEITDQTPDAKALSLRCDLLLPLLLNRTTWNFSIVYKSDNTPTTTPFSPDYLYAYQLPADFGRFFKMASNCFPLTYQFVDGLLLTSVKPISYYYIANNVDYAALTSMFTRALAVYLAADMCDVITNNEALAKRLMEKAEREISNAVLLNDMERLITSAPSNDFDRQYFF